MRDFDEIATTRWRSRVSGAQIETRARRFEVRDFSNMPPLHNALHQAYSALTADQKWKLKAVLILQRARARVRRYWATTSEIVEPARLTAALSSVPHFDKVARPVPCRVRCHAAQVWRQGGARYRNESGDTLRDACRRGFRVESDENSRVENYAPTLDSALSRLDSVLSSLGVQLFFV
ncbi:hypothetical protein Scep_022240 [Stephania cephalantha]|uniref:Uncharacterized protein n=1 Tax=Stephania cephalantha TaxID=152367 RepID=A0AAP0F506_9MAGN